MSSVSVKLKSGATVLIIGGRHGMTKRIAECLLAMDHDHVEYPPCAVAGLPDMDTLQKMTNELIAQARPMDIANIMEINAPRRLEPLNIRMANEESHDPYNWFHDQSRKRGWKR